eukprot:GHVR01115216.1.p1 GENE.GHVR01115216.1~~GHVR01115216.1.p1  ORF type:complete len:373 (-),score=62.53 GHVR01115216.1:275-1393(-)
MAEASDGVMTVLPRWGGGMGAIYTTAHSLVYQLKKEGKAVSCVLGTTLAELSEADKAHIKQLGAEILEPNTENEEQSKSPEERIQNVEYYQELYENIETVLRQTSTIISFSQTTYQLASHLLHKTEASNCELVLFNHRTSMTQEEKTDLAETARSANTVFSVGHSAFKYFEQSIKPWIGSNVHHHQYTPDYSNQQLMQKEVSLAVIHVDQVFVPWNDESGESFGHNCVCVVNLLNLLNKELQANSQAMNILIQRTTNEDSKHYATCSSIGHTHQNYKCVVYSSTEEIIKAAKSSAIVLASGQFTETGFSGLEFLMNGCLVLFEDGTDVANMLKTASPELASKFLLCKTDDSTNDAKHTSLSQWAEMLKKKPG